jgi:gamma-glutamyl-gamma-aminobutyrate hydrolase PuuD
MIILPLCLVWIALTATPPNQFPIIGIYTQSDTSDEPPTPNHQTQSLKGSNYSYIPASYVKYIQMSGAQVVPIFAYSNRDYFDELLPQINGVLFPGIPWHIKVEMSISTSPTYGRRTQTTY